MLWFDLELWGNSLRTWGIALTIALSTAIVLRLITLLARRRQQQLIRTQPEGVPGRIAGLIGQTRSFFVMLLALQLGALALSLPTATRQALRTLMVIGTLVQLGFWGNALIRFFMQARASEDPTRKTTFNALEIVSRVAMWAVVVLLALDNIPGVEINTLIASLGIGGVAAALAVQNVLGDLFASVSIALDRPFKIGDLILVDGFQGTIERIGLRSTRLQSLSGEQLIFSNSDLLNSRIRNFRLMQERRVVFTFGVASDTPNEMLSTIPGIVRELIEAQDNTRFDRAHFKEIGDFTLNFEAAYYVLSGDYADYMDCQQAINLGLLDQLQRRGVELPFPSYNVILQPGETAPSVSFDRDRNG